MITTCISLYKYIYFLILGKLLLSRRGCKFGFLNAQKPYIAIAQMIHTFYNKNNNSAKP